MGDERGCGIDVLARVISSLLQRFGSKFEQPDAELGYGIPDVYKAYKQERKYAAESK